MSEQSQAVFQAALGLSERERATLIQELALTLSRDTEELLDNEMVEELDRRRAEFEQGTADPLPWDQLKSELRAELDGNSLSSPGSEGSSQSV